MRHKTLGTCALVILLAAGCGVPIKRGPEFSHYLASPSPYRLVETMSGKDNLERLDVLTKALDSSRIPYEAQPFVFKGARGTNVVVEYGTSLRTFLIATHYDRVQRTPGANDNASCVAAAITAYRLLKNAGNLKNIKVRFLFTDQEESGARGPGLGLGGSRSYIAAHGVDDILGAVSFEACGIGDAFGAWDVFGELKTSRVVKALQQAGEVENIYNATHKKVPRNRSDHRAFHEAGVPAVAVTILPRQDEAILREYINNPNAIKWLKVSNRPLIFQTYHNAGDVPESLSPAALEMASRIIFRTVQAFDEMSAND